jgi:hypothetical protein
VKRPFLKGRPPVSARSSGVRRSRCILGSLPSPPPLSVNAHRSLAAGGQSSQQQASQ